MWYLSLTPLSLSLFLLVSSYSAAQISDWRLILYGTESPAQHSTDGKPINVDVHNSVESERSSDRWLNSQQVSEKKEAEQEQ